MRPSRLDTYFSAASGLKGIGARTEKALGRLLHPGFDETHSAARLVDLLFHLPTGLINRRNRPKIADLPETGIVTIKVEIGIHRPAPRRAPRAPYRVDCFDDTGNISLVFFHVRGDYLVRQMPVGETRYVSGKVEWYHGQAQIVHPDHVLTETEFARMPLVEPVYPLGAGVSGKVIARAIEQALEQLPALPEWIDATIIADKSWMGFNATLKAAHRPDHTAALEPQAPVRQRLAYDELLANQLAIALVRRRMKTANGRIISGDGSMREKVLDRLDYELTGTQQQALAEILRDMASRDRMLRLLQGDVGAGKTIVALLAMLTTCEAGHQAALMVPSEILSRQHFKSISQLLEGLEVRVDLITGRDRGKQREAKLTRIGSGETDIVVGTHALFQSDITFKDLAVVVIDEQHRFGVHQRLALQSKADKAPDVLVMTATPIPRTLTLTLYGDMDVSRLTEKPPGRQPVDTRVMSMEKLGDVASGLARPITGGGRVYWVCPLVEDVEELGLASAEDRFKALSALYPGKVGLVHGRMKGTEKDDVMARFQTGEISILVATTVIEVGVDVPEASVMVIENAEQFGLAQLHQLRGRVGRGAAKSSCVLLYKPGAGQTAMARLSIMRETEDGFLIAEEDLRLRGSGELLGVRQSGTAAFRLANPIEHRDLLTLANKDAALVLQTDPYLQSARGKALRLLLYLFERDAAIRLLESG